MTDDDTATVIPTLSLSAAATVDAVPDEAHIGFDLTADGRSSNGALDAVRKRLDDFDKICDDLDIPAADRSSTVTVSEQGERDGTKWLSKGYRATAKVQMVVRDVDTVGPLVSGVVAEAGPGVRGPFWRVSPDHPARIEACAKAGAQARAKAEAYARALGIELGPIVSMNEGSRVAPPIREAGAPPAPMAMSAAVPAGAARARGGAEAAPAPAIDLHPGTQEVRADISVIFRIDQD